MADLKEIAALLLVGAALIPGAQGADVAVDNSAGPTIHLDYDRADSAGNPVQAFLYFIPLISPEPVTSSTTPGNTQSGRVTSATRKQSASSFKTICDFELNGAGAQENNFDLGTLIHRHEERLRSGGKLQHQLRSITIVGAGRGRVEVKGTITNGFQTVNEVELRFNAEGQTSPVAIALCDVRYVNGEYRLMNEMVARVNTLTFRRKAGPPKMEVSVASVKNKGAGDGLWQNLKGSLKGVAANLAIEPLTVDAVGHRVMLEFGQALATGAPSFTFPHAKNLKEDRS